MLNTKWINFTFFAISFLASYCYADIRIINNTDYFATGRVSFSPCSSAAGDAGIIKPHRITNIPQKAIEMFCSKSCSGDIFLSTNCTGKKVAIAKIDRHRGVVSFVNLDKEHIVISGGGGEITVNPASKGFKSWFKNFLNL